MATNTNSNWDKKGKWFGKFMFYNVVLFVILMMWIYRMNGAGL